MCLVELFNYNSKKSFCLQTLLSSGSSTTSRASSVSDIYFDDEFTGAPLNKQDRHMRLNTTLNLEYPSNDGRFCSPFVAAHGCSRKCTGKP